MTSSVAPFAVARRVPRAARGVRVPAHERLNLANGATLIVVPRRDLPLLAFSALLRGGARCDPSDRAGVSALVAGLIGKGAGTGGAFAFADAVARAGGTFSAHSTPDYLLAGGQFLAAHQGRMLELLATALLEPRWPRPELEALRTRQIELIKAAKDSDPAELLGAYGRAFLFRRHPYGRAITGSEASLAALGIDDARRYYRAHCGGDRLVLVFAGDVNAPRLVDAAAQAFGDWRRARTPLAPLAAAHAPRRRRVLLIDLPGAAQSYFWIGGLGVERRYPRRAALELVNTLFGGRFTSLLNTELRIRAGLTYGAGSSFTRGAARGEFAIRSFTQAKHTCQALDLALGALARLKRDGVSAQMLDSARTYVLGQYPLAFETAADWAAALAELEAYGLTADHIDQYEAALRAVTVADARAVIDEAFPPPERCVLVVIGDAEILRAPLARYGELTEMPLVRPSFAAPSRRHTARAVCRRPRAHP
ncbi:MAG TPA: pitrilysin family protein [Steroidobacteraceae bacterium]|nr:pitrilysin family protein [Steroidobacteraceae bacterium]